MIGFVWTVWIKSRSYYCNPVRILWNLGAELLLGVCLWNEGSIIIWDPARQCTYLWALKC